MVFTLVVEQRPGALHLRVVKRAVGVGLSSLCVFWTWRRYTTMLSKAFCGECYGVPGLLLRANRSL